MERDNRDEDMMLKGTKQEMPGFYFRLLRSEEKRELWNPDFELLFLLRGTGRVSYEDGEVHSLRSEERRVGKECRSRWSPYH